MPFKTREAYLAYQRQYNKEHKRHGKKKYQSKMLVDGSLNPKYRGHQGKTYETKFLEDGNLNPKYQGRKDFIAIDGEGVTRSDGVTHDYVLLCASTGERISNPDGLSTADCFTFLIELAKRYPHAIFVCFGASYDINQMLRDVPKNKLQELWKGQGNSYGTDNKRSTTYKDYALEYRKRKSFTIRKYGNPKFIEKTTRHKDGTTSVNWVPNFVASLVLWDVIGFFQGRFVDVLGDKKAGYFNDLLQGDCIVFPDGYTVDLARMKNMKNKRGSFTVEELESDILPYCMEEVETLARLMERLRAYLLEAGLQLARWDGAGACAGAMLKRENIKDYMHEKIPDKALYHAQLCAYSGGRIELGMFGVYIGAVYNYDINSAYPNGMQYLPALTNGMWRRIKGYPTRPYSLIHVHWDFAEDLPYYPFFLRDNNGSIFYPCFGKGWYWKVEVDAALRVYKSGKLSTDNNKGTIEILEAWEFAPYDESVKPFAFIPKVFEQRAEWKKRKCAAEKVLKLGINSLGGKTAQSLGGSADNPPPYHNIGWAGYFTAYTRAMIFDAIMQAPDKVIAIATDGIFSTVPLHVPLGDGLGHWGEKIGDGIVAVQAGVYWTLTKLDAPPTEEELTSQHANETYLHYQGIWYKTAPHYRGFDQGSITPAMVLNAWEQCYQEGISNATLPVHITRFVTLGSALANPDLWQYWRTWRTAPRELDLFPTGKRDVTMPDETEIKTGKRYLPAHQQLLQTNAAIPSTNIIVDENGWIGEDSIPTSQPFKLGWERSDGDYGTVDGVDNAIIADEIIDSES
jgi:DNA polymerase type B, organellar and viral